MTRTLISSLYDTYITLLQSAQKTFPDYTEYFLHMNLILNHPPDFKGDHSMKMLWDERYPFTLLQNEDENRLFDTSFCHSRSWSNFPRDPLFYLRTWYSVSSTIESTYPLVTFYPAPPSLQIKLVKELKIRIREECVG